MLKRLKGFKYSEEGQELARAAESRADFVISSGIPALGQKPKPLPKSSFFTKPTI